MYSVKILYITHSTPIEGNKSTNKQTKTLPHRNKVFICSDCKLEEANYELLSEHIRKVKMVAKNDLTILTRYWVRSKEYYTPLPMSRY